jgi:hypothetical protein
VKQLDEYLLSIEEKVSALRNDKIKPYDFGLLRERLWTKFNIKNLCPLNQDGVIAQDGTLEEGTCSMDRMRLGGGVLIIENKQPGEHLNAGQRYNLEHLAAQNRKQVVVIVHHSGNELLKKNAWWFDPVAVEIRVNGRTSEWVKVDATREQVFDAIAVWYQTGTFSLGAKQ